VIDDEARMTSRSKTRRPCPLIVCFYYTLFSTSYKGLFKEERKITLSVF